MHTDLSLPSTTEHTTTFNPRPAPPRLAWGAILGGTVAAIGIHILLTALGVGAGLATFSPITDADPVASLSIGSAIVWTLCALVALGFGGLIAGRFSHSLHSGFVHGVLVWCSTLILTLLLVTVGTGMVMGGALKVFGASMGMGGEVVAGGVSELAKEALHRNSNQLGSFIDEAVQSGPTNAAPSAITQANREIGFALTRLFTPGNETNSVANRAAAIQAVARYSGMSEPDATKAVDGWIVSAKSLKAELESLQATAEEKTRAAADVTADHLSNAALWSFFGLLVGLLLTAMCGHYGAKCAARCIDSRECLTGTTDPAFIPSPAT